MTFQIRADGVDVQEVMARIRARIVEKKAGLLSEEEVREIADHRLPGVLDAHDFKSGLLEELLDQPSRWNYTFGPETLYRSSRGAVGRLLETVRKVLGPIQKLFWNPNPMITALSRQSDLNTYYVHLLHNLALEVTRLNLEVQDLKNRNLQLQAQVEFLARRGKVLEGMVSFRPTKEADAPLHPGEAERGGREGIRRGTPPTGAEGEETAGGD